MLRFYTGTNILFESTEAHDEHLLACINIAVMPKDELFILGDFADKKPGKYRARIKCKHVYLIRGNHDPVQKSRNVFGEIPYERHTKLRWGNMRLPVVLSHTPKAFWEGSHNGWAHLYGHTHGQREQYLDAALGSQRRSMDVGIDNLFRAFGTYGPISERHLFQIFIERLGHDLREYYENIQDERDRLFGFDPATRGTFNGNQ